MSARGLASAVAVALIGVAAGARAQAPDADAIEAAAVADFQAGRYREALRSFERLYRLRPEPTTLFAMGRCYEQLGDCARSREIFEDYLASRPDAAARRAAEERIAACRPLDPVDPVPPPAPVVAPVAPAARPTTRRRTPLVVTLAGVGLGVGAVAGVLEFLGRSHLDEARAAGEDGDRTTRDAEYDRAQRFHWGAQVGAVVATGLVAAAGVVWWTRPREGRAVVIAPQGEGAVVSWSGRF